MKTMRKSQYTHRLLARVLIEANTPLSIGTGNESILTDSLVALDTNDLPYIPGTTIAGIFKHLWDKNLSNVVFGYQAAGKVNDGKGSRIIFSSAQIIGKDKKVIDGIKNIDFNDSFYQHFLFLPIRQHVRINSKGTNEHRGKFDEQIVFKGCRFCFEIEIVGTEQEISEFNLIQELLQKKTLRIGSGTRSGFGEINLIEYKQRILNLYHPEDLDAYLYKSSDLSDNSFWELCPSIEINQTEHNGWTSYEVELTANDFFLFGSGHGNDVANITPVASTIITSWDKEEAEFGERCVLIPASSVKGALSHRVAYHYNIRKKIFADSDELKEEEYKKHTGSNNQAVKILFGSESNSSKSENTGSRGNVIISDVIISEEPDSTKILNHVAINRFTGGTISGAQFNEQVNCKTHHPLTLHLLVFDNALNDEDVKYAFEHSLIDLCSGMLPLGGGINRGHGCFTGTIKINGQLL